METAKQVLQEFHLQVAPSLIAPAPAALAPLIPALEMTFPYYHRQEE
jgi:hypothetical protein